MSKKRGRLNKDEQNFIVRNVHELKLSELAEKLNRTEGTIQKFITKKKLIRQEDSWEEEQSASLSSMLHNQPYWPELQDEFTEDELVYFEKNWIKLMKQFREDVLYSEEWGGIKQWITLDIMMHRIGKENKGHIEEMEGVRKKIQEEEDKDERDTSLLMAMTQELNFLRSAMSSYVTTRTKLLNEVKYIAKSLKANRDERIKRIEDGKSSWQGFLRMIEDDKVRKRMGEDAELMRLAKDASKKRLSAWHEFEDGMVDRPFLTPETVTEEDNE